MATVTSAGEHLHKAIHPLYCAKGSYDGPAIRNLIEAALAQARAEGKAEGMREGREEDIRIAKQVAAFWGRGGASADEVASRITREIALPSPPADGETKL